MFIHEMTIDDREPRYGWYAGYYLHAECNECGESFIGGKRATTCASCAYDDKIVEIGEN